MLQEFHTLQNLKPGAWFSIDYGNRNHLLYIVNNTEKYIIFDHPDWCYTKRWKVLKKPRKLNNSIPRWEIKDIKDFLMRNPKFLGYGKYRWFGGYMRKKTDCIGTIYTYPKSIKKSFKQKLAEGYYGI